MRSLTLSLLLAVATGSTVLAQEYKTAREARAAASPHLRSRNFAAAQAPLEAALKLTPESDTRERVDLYRTLMACYRLLPEPDKMIEAVEYLQDHSPSRAERSNVASDFVSFMHQRGKTEASITRYEEKLKKNPKDPTALAVLSKTYLQIERETKKERGEQLEAQLKELNRERAAAEAERMSKTADAPANAAAFNWMNVAKMWLEAENKAQAKAATDRALQAEPEARTGILTMQWREGMGDILLELGEHAAAEAQYLQAKEAAPGEVLKNAIDKKLKKARVRNT